MVIQVVISQCFVWYAILTERLKFYFFEELGWGIIFVLNTIASIILYWTLDNINGRELLLQLNLLFGAIYLPWQVIHLKILRKNINDQKIDKNFLTTITLGTLIKGLYKSIQIKNQTTKSENWGGVVGMTWMASYWATVIPFWIYLIVRTV